ncbi:NUDIX domain-containing protein [Streptomyces sp. MP131-18]|uniref:NUDIX hydrolase n=1 Tax=Streptomyces sp. MP131-18 TaxID=1857892 RepID=UPI00097BE298|nr:NUDIX domain-containing protein [Streptomyces sp. MP131-18]ONK12742.1 Nudix hydrolase [Streptomyces sp. MP131-18]
MALRDVINENDEVIGQAEKEEIQQKKLICRVAFVIIVNSAQELLLQQRSARKKAYPLYWSGAAAGHVHSGETYEQAAARELKEELGVTAPLRYLGKHFSAEDREMVASFLAFHDGPYNIERHEIEKIDFFTLERLRQEMPGMKVTSFLERALPLIDGKLG